MSASKTLTKAINSIGLHMGLRGYKDTPGNPVTGKTGFGYF